MIKIIFMTLIFSFTAAQAGQLEDAYYKATRECTNDAEKLYKDLSELDKKISEYKKFTTVKQSFEKAQSNDFEGQIILYLGAYLLGPIDKGDLIPQRSCWLYYNNYLIHESRKDSMKSKKDFKTWRECLGGLNEGVLPEVTENIVSCYKKSHAN